MRGGSLKRLLQKELLEIHRVAVGLLTVVFILLLLRDPLSFREEPYTMSGWVSVPLAMAFLMGLSAYSREIAGGTLPFLLSRPVGVWRLAIAKLLAGFLVCLAAAFCAALVYAVTMPAVYRPHAGAGFLASGAMVLATTLGLSFLAGFSGSMLASGLVTSLAVAVVIVAGLGYAGDQIAHLYTGEAWSYVMLAGIPVAALAAVAPLALLEPRRRILRWFGVAGAAILASVALALVLRVTNPRPSYDHLPIESPDRSRTIHSTDTWPMPRGPADLWLETGEGKFRRLEEKVRTRVLGWTPDSGSVLYAVRTNLGPDQLRVASVENDWTPRTLLDLPSLPFPKVDLFDGVLPGGLLFAPSRQRFAIELTDSIDPRSVVLVMDLDTLRVRVIPVKGGLRLWWMDDDHLVVLDGETPRIIRP